MLMGARGFESLPTLKDEHYQFTMVCFRLSVTGLQASKRCKKGLH